MNNPHPKGSRARVLLSSVFGPYARDDEFGSRSINPMELYHNQVTKAQGSFSLRRFHRSWGILMIQENISAPCAVLDFPTREAFARELKSHDYDIVGISSIIVNVGKARDRQPILAFSFLRSERIEQLPRPGLIYARDVALVESP